MKPRPASPCSRSTTIGDLQYSYDAAGRRTLVSGSLAKVNLPAALGPNVFSYAQGHPVSFTDPLASSRGRRAIRRLLTSLAAAEDMMELISELGEVTQYFQRKMEPFETRLTTLGLGTISG